MNLFGKRCERCSATMMCLVSLVGVLVTTFVVGPVSGSTMSNKAKVQELLSRNPFGGYQRPAHVVRHEPIRRPPTPPPMPKFSPPEEPRSRTRSRTYQDVVRVLNNNSPHNARTLPSPREAPRPPRRPQSVTQELEDIRQANEHFLRIRTTAKCGVPKARVVRVKDFHNDASREYLPRCTVLHRCGDDSGCCDNDNYRCVSRAVQEVALYFYTISLEHQDGETRLRDSVSKLLFTNHTECECQPINDIPRSGNSKPIALALRSSPPKITVTTPAPTTSETPVTTFDPDYNDDEDYQDSKCARCPEPFTKRLYEDGRCSCDCYDKQKPCLRIKRGRESLGELQRRCVEINECHLPDCEYGIYDVTTGRCPRRPDYLPKHVEQRRQHPHIHRNHFFERD